MSNADDTINEAFDGNFIAAEDIMQSGEITLMMDAVIPANTERDRNGKGKPIDKLILAFKGAKKRLILNKTNIKTIASMYGKKSADWIGQKVTLTVCILDQVGEDKNVPSVRIKADYAGMSLSRRKNYGRPYFSGG